MRKLFGNKYFVILCIIFLLFLLLGGVYAINVWTTTDYDINLKSSCFDIRGNSSYTLLGSDLVQFDENDIIDTTNTTINYQNGMIYYPFNIVRGNMCNTSVYYSIVVDVTSLSLDYRNGCLKYKIIDNMRVFDNDVIENPLNEDLPYVDGGSIYGTGSITLYSQSINKNTNIIPAIVFYIDGDMVDPNASDLTFSASISVVASSDDSSSKIADYVTNLYMMAAKTSATVNGISYNLSSSVNLMNDRLGGTTSLDGGNIRYYGANPSNYVWLGDYYNEDFTFNSNGGSVTRKIGDKKLWRIIGVFDGKVKLISNDPISASYLSWDNHNENNNTGVNEWSYSDLMMLLNNGYENAPYNSSFYWNKNDNFTNTGLSAGEKSLITSSTWYLGGSEISLLYPDLLYASERGSLTGRECSSSVLCTDQVSRSLTWNGKVGLMSPSDYGYATDLSLCTNSLDSYNVSACYSNDWLFNSSFSKWMISPVSSSSNANLVFILSSSGALDSSLVNSSYMVYPTVYLSGNSLVSRGNGSENLPYVISLE